MTIENKIEKLTTAIEQLTAAITGSHVAPVQQPPTGVQAGGVPNQGVPNQGAPIQGVPTQGVPTQGVPTQGVPTQGGGAMSPQEAQQRIMATLQRLGRPDAIQAVMQKYGGMQLTQINPAAYPQLIAEIEALQ